MIKFWINYKEDLVSKNSVSKKKKLVKVYSYKMKLFYINKKVKIFLMKMRIKLDLYRNYNPNLLKNQKVKTKNLYHKIYSKKKKGFRFLNNFY